MSSDTSSVPTLAALAAKVVGEGCQEVLHSVKKEEKKKAKEKMAELKKQQDREMKREMQRIREKYKAIRKEMSAKAEAAISKRQASEVEAAQTEMEVAGLQTLICGECHKMYDVPKNECNVEGCKVYETCTWCESVEYTKCWTCKNTFCSKHHYDGHYSDCSKDKRIKCGFREGSGTRPRQYMYEQTLCVEGHCGTVLEREGNSRRRPLSENCEWCAALCCGDCPMRVAMLMRGGDSECVLCKECFKFGTSQFGEDLEFQIIIQREIRELELIQGFDIE